MWPFSSPLSLAHSGLLAGFTDCHSHLLPGVDDGVQTLEETLALLKEYEQLGITSVWLTPHIMEDIPNKPAELKARFAALQDAYQGPVTLHLAAEHMLDSLFEERLRQGDVLPIGREGNRLLVETSYFNPPVGMQDLLHQVQEAGYYPLLAHPERYTYMDRGDYRALKASGIRFQLNLPSLVGVYGPEAKAKALYLLSVGAYDEMGTDTHRLQSFLRVVGQKKLDKKTIRCLEELRRSSTL